MYVRPRYRRTVPASGADAPAPGGGSAAPGEAAAVPRRSHVALIPAVLVLALGLYLGTFTILAPAILGLFLLSGGFSLLGTRLNPLSAGFYLTTKPSWTAIGAVLAAGFSLLWMTYEYYRNAWGPILPHLPGV